MKIIILFLSLLVVTPVSNDDAITWNEDKKLTWADFKAQPDSNSDAAALTASGITFGFAVKTSGSQIVDFSTTVSAQFYPHKSWYIKDKANPHVLAHEQLHFDITELYARQFRKELALLKVNRKIKAQMKALHSQINTALNERQQRYDLETNHSMNETAQQEWKTNIAQELKQLESFQSL
ncbi:MAG: DUF922 domain-containing protein [Winogradskyella arenosi]